MKLLVPRKKLARWSLQSNNPKPWGFGLLFVSARREFAAFGLLTLSSTNSVLPVGNQRDRFGSRLDSGQLAGDGSFIA
jgi:hypothetical protein